MVNPDTEDSVPRVGSRGAERVSVEVVVDARNGHHRLRAEVVDISASGVRLRTLNPFRVGHTFWVKLPMIESKEVTVAWVNGFVSGCSFMQPLAPCVLETVFEAVARPDAALTYFDRRTVYRV